MAAIGLNVGKAVAYLELDTSGFTSGFHSAGQDLNKFRDQTQTAETRIGALGNAMKTAGSTLTKSVTVPLAGIGGAALKVGTDFEYGMAKVQAISGATGDDFEALREMALEMGNKTKFSASEAAEGLQYMAMAGWKTEDMLQGLEPILNLAVASGEDLGTTSDIVTDAMTAFGMSAKETTRFVDVLAAASANSNTNVSILGESFKYVAPVAGSLGYSVEDTAIALGLMANSGIKASQSGTALRTIITNMAKPTDNMALAMDKLGISLENEDGSMKSLKEVMDNLRESFGGSQISADEFNNSLSDLNAQLESGQITQEEYDEALEALTVSAYGVEGAEKAKYAAMLAGKEAMPGLLSLISASEQDYNKLTDSIYGSKGATQEMVDIMSDTLQGAFDRLKSNLETAGIKISDVLKPAVLSLVDALSSLVTWFTSLPKPIQEFLVVLSAIVAIAGPILIFIGNLIKSIGSIIGLFKNITTVVSTVVSSLKILWGVLIANPIGLIITAIVGIVAGFVYLWNHCEAFREFWIGLWEGIKGIVSSVADAIGGFFTETIPEKFEQFTEFLSGIGETLGIFFTETIPTFFMSIPEKLGEMFVSLMEMIGINIEAIGLFFTETIPEMLGNFGEWLYLFFTETIPEKFNSFVETVQGVVDQVLDFFLTLIPEGLQEFAENVYLFFTETIPEVLGHFPEEVGKIIDTVFGNIKQWGEDIVEKAIEIGGDFVNGVLEFFSLTPYEMGVVVGEALRKIVEWERDMIKKAAEIGEKFVKKIIDFIKNLPGKVSEWTEKTWERVTTWGKDMVKKAGEVGKDFVDGFVNFFKKLPDKAKEFIDNTIEKIKTWKNDMIQNAKEAAGQFLENVSIKFGEAKEHVVSFVENTIKKVGEWASDMIKKAKEAGEGFVKNVIGKIQNLPGEIYNKISGAIGKVRTWGTQMINAGKEAIGGFVKNIVDRIKDLPGTVVKWVKSIPDQIKNLKNNFHNAAIHIMNGFIEGLNKAVKVIWDFVKSFAKGIGDFLSGVVAGFTGTAKKKNGSHSNGLDYVPYDGYVAELHKGERVLTRSENEAYTKGELNRGRNEKAKDSGGNGGDTFNFYNTKPEPYEYYRQMKRAKRELLQGV